MPGRATPKSQKSRPRIAILGGGFAGLAAAQTLDADRYEVTLFDRRRAFEWLPNIHELLSGVKTPDDLRLPLDALLARSGHRFVRDTVTGIDPAAGTLSTRRRRRPVPYDALIVTCGGVDATRGVDGVEEHAFGFKSVDECHRIGRRLRRLESRKRPARVVIVGGGLEGVEALGEILRGPRASQLEITLVEAGTQLLAEAPEALDAHIRRLCRRDAVAFETGTPVERISTDSVVLGDGRTLASDLTIWTGGPAPPALLAKSGLAPEGEWAPVDRTLQSKGYAEVFIAGDAAELPTPLARQAYHALDMGTCAARNATRQLAGRSLEPFLPSSKPMLVSFGDRSCFLIAGDRVVAGPALGAAKEAVFELTMAQIDARGWRERLPDVARRAEGATRRLLWPSLRSPQAWLRNARLSIL